MRVKLNFIFSDLPEQVSNLIFFILGVPITIAVTKLISLSLPDELKANHSIFVFVILGIIISTVFGAFGSYVPKIVRTKTSIASFMLWIIISISFSVAAYNFYDQLSFGIGTSASVSMLFLLVIYFHSKDIWNEIKITSSENINFSGVELLAKGLMIGLVLFCIITMITLPILSFAVKNIKRSFLAGTILHTLSFFLWFLLTGMVAACERSK